MKTILTILCAFLFAVSFGQPVSSRSNSSVTVSDARLQAQLNLFIPRYADTTAASAAKGVDSCGAIIFVYADSGKMYIRRCFPVKYWFAIGGGGGSGGSGFTSANNGLIASSSTLVQLGGSSITQPTAIPLVSNPIQIVHNAIDTTTTTDSNSVYLANLSSAPATNSAYVSPAIVFATSGRKTAGGAAATPVSFRIDAYGRLQNPSGGGALRIGVRKNSGAYTLLYSIDELGRFGQNLNVNGTLIGAGSGSGGVAIGFGSPLQLQTSGAVQSIAIGSAALAANTDGNSNVAIGANSLLSNITGSFNIGIGAATLGNQTSADNNIAIGYHALFLTTGGSNTAVGTNSLSANTTAIKNTAIGAGSLEETTIGGFNNAHGEDAMLHNVSGTDNNAFGWLALSLSTAGIGNVGIGNSTARSVSAGDYSIYIGMNAGYLGNQVATCTGCILLGANTYATATHQMILGDTSLTSTFIRGARVGSVSDSIYAKGSDNSLHTIAQSSIVGATPTLQQVLTAGSSVSVASQSITGTGSNLLNFTNFDEFDISNMTGNSHFGGGGIYNFDADVNINDLIHFEVATTTQTALNSGILERMNSLTSGTGHYVLSTSITSGNLLQLVSTSTALAANNEMLDIAVTGVNGTNAITATGARISVTNTNGTSGTNVGLSLTASGATTDNIALNIVAGYLKMNGPASSLTMGPKRRVFFDSDANPALDELFYAKDNENIALDAWFDGNASAWKASDASAFILTKNAATFIIQGNSGLTPGNTFTPTPRFIVAAGGNVTIGSLAGTGSRAVLADAAGLLSAPVSDRDAKFNIHPYTGGLNALMSVDAVNFFYKEKYQHFGTSEQIGFIAQDIQTILPNSVYINKDGTKGFNAFDLIPVLWRALQEQQKEIEYLKSKIK